MYKPGTFSWKFFEKKVCPSCEKRSRFCFESPENPSDKPKTYKAFCLSCGIKFQFIRGKDHYEIRMMDQLELNFTGEKHETNS